MSTKERLPPGKPIDASSRRRADKQRRRKILAKSTLTKIALSVSSERSQAVAERKISEEEMRGFGDDSSEFGCFH